MAFWYWARDAVGGGEGRRHPARRFDGHGGAGRGSAGDGDLPGGRHHSRRRGALPEGPRSLAADPRAERHCLAGGAEAGGRAEGAGGSRWRRRTRRSPSRWSRSRRPQPRARGSSRRRRSVRRSKAGIPRWSGAAIGAWAEVVSYSQRGDRACRHGAENLGGAARPGGGGGSLGRPGRGGGPGAGPAALVARAQRRTCWSSMSGCGRCRARPRR